MMPNQYIAILQKIPVIQTLFGAGCQDKIIFLSLLNWVNWNHLNIYKNIQVYNYKGSNSDNGVKYQDNALHNYW